MKAEQNLITVEPRDIAAFNHSWPCSPLDPDKTYTFEFDNTGNLIDTNVDEDEDGSAASAIADDCRALFLDGDWPAWARTA